MNDDSDFAAISIKTAARLTDLDDSTIRAAVNAQDLPAYRVGRAIRIDKADLRDWLRSRPRVGEEGQ